MLYLFPGIGADARLFRSIPDAHVIDWIPPAHARETLADYARRLASGLRIEEPFELGGASFGGMVALEVARHLAPRRVILFGSCRSARSIAPELRVLGRIVPIVRPPRIVRRAMARWFGAQTEGQIALFADMLSAAPIAFVRWASYAGLTWDGVDELPMPVRHIHGERDRIIPAGRVSADRVVAGAGHLLNLTHPDAVNEFIA